MIVHILKISQKTRAGTGSGFSLQFILSNFINHELCIKISVRIKFCVQYNLINVTYVLQLTLSKALFPLPARA